MSKRTSGGTKGCTFYSWHTVERDGSSHPFIVLHRSSVAGLANVAAANGGVELDGLPGELVAVVLPVGVPLRELARSSAVLPSEKGTSKDNSFLSPGTAKRWVLASFLFALHSHASVLFC